MARWITHGGVASASSGDYLLTVRRYGSASEGEVRSIGEGHRLAAAVYPDSKAAQVWCERYAAKLHLALPPVTDWRQLRRDELLADMWGLR